MRNTSDKQNNHRRKKARKASLEIQYKPNGELTDKLEWPKIEGFASEITPKVEVISKQSIFTEIKQGILTNLEGSEAEPETQSQVGKAKIENSGERQVGQEQSCANPEGTGSEKGVLPLSQRAHNALVGGQSQDLANTENVFGEINDLNADNEELDIQRKEIHGDQLKGIAYNQYIARVATC